MADPKDEQKESTGSNLDRRKVLSGALLVGGVSVLAGTAALSHAATAAPIAAAAAVQTPPPAETEWARALTRTIINQLPEALKLTPDIKLTTAQVVELQNAFENTLLTNMGCTVTG